MNAVTPINPASGSLTMSSREIAELTGKNHRDVMRDARVMFEQLALVERKFASYYTASNGKRNLCFKLPKDLTITLVAGYRADLRHRIVTRWLELEEEKQSTALALPDFSNPAAAARAWADEVEAKEKAQALVTYAQEVVEKLEPYARVGRLAVDR
ncbi:Rha family transcriptional regulator [Cohaesibacter marisflavi]|uniref:Rha family transcriptional regulator n=1 Tax=Cohaesibacter marisflavi TaxID=655353 RepID=UPI0029C95618|nr:Rha family transcriptional regulator [Cohaesibacter marisflavi]